MKMPLKSLIATADYVMVNGLRNVYWSTSLIPFPGQPNIELAVAKLKFRNGTDYKTVYFLANELVELDDEGACEIEATVNPNDYTTPFPSDLGKCGLQFGIYTPLTMVEAFKRIHLNVQ